MSNFFKRRRREKEEQQPVRIYKSNSMHDECIQALEELLGLIPTNDLLYCLSLRGFLENVLRATKSAAGAADIAVVNVVWNHEQSALKVIFARRSSLLQEEKQCSIIDSDRLIDEVINRWAKKHDFYEPTQ